METKVLTRLGKSMAILTISSLTTHAIQAQSLVRGQVTDTKGEPLMGATIKVKNSQEGAITDLDGKFSFESKRTLTAKDRLEVKYVGFKTQEIEYSNKVLQVLLEEDAEEINEVVVTALGIKRDEKGLGYATTKVEGSQITGTMPANWSSALTGKVAGLSIISSGGPLSTSRISVRGDVSLNANGNNALVVVDGVPLSSPMTNPGMAYGAGDAAELSVDYGNGFSDLNPEDIESIQVLKGASATALYGSRAANGVIMVTTKSGANAKKGLGVSYSAHVSMDNVMRWPDYQYEFGQGQAKTSVRKVRHTPDNITIHTVPVRTGPPVPVEPAAHSVRVSKDRCSINTLRRTKAVPMLRLLGWLTKTTGKTCFKQVIH